MIYCFLADGFEELEAIAPVDLLRRVDNTEVKFVSLNSNKISTSSHSVQIFCDLSVSEIELGDTLEAIILPGGMPGTLGLENSSNVQKAIDFCIDKEKYICAICAAPSILGHRNLLKGKKATCFNGFESELLGAKVTGESVVTDGKIITARGAGVAIDFGLEIIKELRDEKTSKKIKEMILCK